MSFVRHRLNLPFEIIIYLKERMASFVPTNSKSVGSLKQVLESLPYPPPKIRYTLRKTASLRKLLVIWWTIPQISIKSWFSRLNVLCKPGFHFLVYCLKIITPEPWIDFYFKNLYFRMLDIDQPCKWTDSINEKAKSDF